MAPRHCSVAGCSQPVFSKGYCAHHHQQLYSTNQHLVNGHDDMVMLTDLTDTGITKNLKLRHKHDIIYTYIGHVLVSVNPFKQIPIYSPEHVKQYSGKYPHELPPHIFALSESAYKQMITEEEDQCVIISGESGAGKTEASKQIMSYIAAVSGKGEGAEKVKHMILESNPLLEAFGNAKTLRNNNSSRFGKYFEIKFDQFGTPRGGFITNYLLEKSRVVYQVKNERNFHIFYQLIKGAPKSAKKALELPDKCSDFFYLNQSGCYEVDHVNDSEEFGITRTAMKVVGLGNKEQEAILQVVAGVLLLGNGLIKEGKSGVKVSNFESAASLLGVDVGALERCISHRHIKTAREEYDVPNNGIQAMTTRDALAKSLYSRLFDWLVKRVNSAIATEGDLPLCCSVLDIYGFEVFEHNGFEQFCINYVNEKLQQIFIELTLKSEQEEYARENIAWKPIPFFNNRGKRPPGIYLILDDVCATIHAQSEGTDRALVEKLNNAHAGHAHFTATTKGFTIKHFAGNVTYTALDFPDKNKDTLFNDVLLVIKTSTRKLIQVLFPDQVDLDNKKRPPTAGFKIKTQAGVLIDLLMKSNPHYVRCIKSNDEKRPDTYDDSRCKHQIQYLGLLENIKVRRAGFAYRQEFHKFLQRFRLLSSRTWPMEWTGSDKDGCKAIMNSVMDKLRLDKAEIQLGKTKIFVKQPETLFALDQLKEDRINSLVSKIQRCWRRYVTQRVFIKMRHAAITFLANRKERRRESFYRPFKGHYLPNFEDNTSLLHLITEYEPTYRIIFIDWCDQIYQSQPAWGSRGCILILTTQAFYIIEVVPPTDLRARAAPPATTGTLADERKTDDELKNQQRSRATTDFVRSATSADLGKTSKLPRSSSTVGDTGKKKKSKRGGGPVEIATASIADDSTQRPTLHLTDTYLLRRRLPLTCIPSISLSTLADNYMILHTRDTPIQSTVTWKPDKSASHCKLCAARFTLFHRRHHCRRCGDIFCQLCSAQSWILPDYGIYQPVRVCRTCYGLESCDPIMDVILIQGKKTELLTLLQDVYKKATSSKLDVQFTDKINITYRDITTGSTPPKSLNKSFTGKSLISQTHVISFVKSKQGHDGIGTTHVNGKGMDVSVVPGLAADFVVSRQKSAEKRRLAYEKKKKAEAALRQKREAEREAQRQEEHRQRIAEKKRMKAERLAQKQAEEDEKASRATSKSVSSSRPTSRPASSTTVSVPACKTCGCDTFTLNLFKKGRCNACFHDHV